MLAGQDFHVDPGPALPPRCCWIAQLEEQSAAAAVEALRTGGAAAP
jgi:hypothetical protein